MKAIVKRSAAPNDIALQDVPVPEIEDDELLVRVQAIGVGIHDSYFLPGDISYPFPIGIEAAGTIEKVGRQASDFQTGERIVFISMMQPKGGVWAEYAAVQKDSLIFRIPENMSFQEAAAVPVAGNTALKALRALPLQSGDSIFIAGASGAIGTFAIPLARERGWQVAASASPKNHDYMRSLGAEKTVDYRDENWPDQIRVWRPGGVDAAIAVQPGTSAGSVRVVKNGGTVITVSNDLIDSERDIRVVPVSHTIEIRDDMTALLQGIADGKFPLAIEQIYPFEKALDALHKTQTRHARGKLVIAVN
jgi:NADPH:quinone reductase-like Zn-dependent oxidoreductase